MLDTRGDRPMMFVRIKMARLRFLRVLAIAVCAAVGESSGQYLEGVVPTGDTPTWIVWSPAVNKVYCSNEQDASITVISGETNQVLTTIQVGDYPSFLCLNADGSKLYCTRGEENRLVIVDTRADTVLKTLNIPNYPGHMVFNSTMSKLYISCNDDPVYRITVLDATADTVMCYIPVRGVGRLLWHPVTNRVFCYRSGDVDTVKVIDCATDQIVTQTPLLTTGGLGVWCHNPVNDFAYLATYHVVCALTPTGDSVMARIPGGGAGDYDLCAVPLPNKVYGAGNGVIRVIDSDSNLVRDSLVVGGGWMKLVYDSEHKKVYCSNASARKVDIIDAQADTLIKTIPLGQALCVACHNRVNSRVYISDETANVVYVLRDTSSGVNEGSETAVGNRWRGTTLTQGAFFWSRDETGALLDVSGRMVAVLRPGHNDLRALAPGVYAAVTADGGYRLRMVKIK
jgi:YVTN family beta-propeller protein